MKIVVAISGASGVVLGKRLVEVLKSDENKGKYEVHLIISEAAKEIAGYEETDLSQARKVADYSYDEDDLEAGIASSSYGVDAMDRQFLIRSGRDGRPALLHEDPFRDSERILRQSHKPRC